MPNNAIPQKSTHMKNTVIFSITRRATAILSGLIITAGVFAQDLKYDDVYSQIKPLPPINAYALLLKYQQQDPHFANTYMQLGNTCETVFKNIDPLREFEYLNYWVSNAVLYYGLFPVYLQKGEVRSNREFYANLPIAAAGKKIENEDALAYLNQRLDYCKNYRDTTQLIFETLQKSKDHYNNSVRIFNEINQRFDNINEALLQTDPAYLTQLNSLKSEYGQCIETFANYKELINRFPIGKYNQTYKVKPIETFRLEGLTNSDFLKDTFELWDYNQWVTAYLDTYNKEIVPLRQEVVKINKTFIDNKRKISATSTINPEDKYSSFDEFFLFRLGKYDNNSLVRELFGYLDSRQNYLITGKLEQNATDSSTAAMSRKIRYYNRLAVQAKQATEKLSVFQKAITPVKIKRFNEFFTQQYQGETGLTSFYSQETDFLNVSFNESLKNLSNYFASEIIYRKSLGNASGKGFSISLFPIEESSPEHSKQTYITQQVSFLQGQPNFVSGYIKRSGNQTMAFVAKIGKDKKVEWLREVGAKGKELLLGGDKAPLHYGSENGCVVLVSGFLDGRSRNTLVRLDNKGKELYASKIAIELFPVYLNFDEISQNSILAFGRNYTDNSKLYNNYVICSTDSLGTIQWQTPIDLNGQLVEIVKSSDKYLAFMNYQSYNINNDRKSSTTPSNGWGHVVVELSERGNIEKSTAIPSTTNLFVNRVFPISNAEFNLIGFENQPGELSEKLKYILINPNGELLFKNY
jgi:hypothetical protein